MKNGFFTLIIVCLFCSPALSRAQQKEPAETRYLDYRGDLKKSVVIGLSLQDTHDHKKLQGVYFYKKYLQDLHLEGEYVGERDIVLRERDAEGVSRGVFALKFVEQDPRGRLRGFPAR